MTKHRIERGVKVAKSQLLPNPWNPNKTKKRQQEAIAESLNLYGQVLEILVRPSPQHAGKYEIIDGEHRYQELQDTVFVNVIHGLPDGDAKKLTIVLNETRGEADKIELAQLLAEIDEELGESAITALPYDLTEYEELLALAQHDWDNYDASNSGGNQGNNNGRSSGSSGSSPTRTNTDTNAGVDDTGDDFDDPPMSGVRMVQLFLDADTQPEFMNMVEFLNPILETDNPTDCVLAVMRQVYRIAQEKPFPKELLG